MTHIKTQLDPHLRDMIRERKTAVIPVGSIEQHGPHMPISTDSDIVYEVSKRLADSMDFWLLPTINYGVSNEHAPFFQLSVKETTLQMILEDLCISLLENGIDTVFIINGHYGNIKAIKDIDRKITKDMKGKLRVFLFSYWQFMERRFDHAGFVETSLMLAISNNVKMKHAQKGLITDGMSDKEVEKLNQLTSKSFPKATVNGVWGDPTEATKEDGLVMLEEITENLQKKCQTCLTENCL